MSDYFDENVSSLSDNSLVKYIENIKLNPMQGQSYFDLAKLLLVSKNPIRAFYACQKGIEYSGYCPETIRIFANCMSHVGLYKEAENLLKMAMCQNTQNPQICYDLGRVLECQGYFHEAVSLQRIGDSIAISNIQSRPT